MYPMATSTLCWNKSCSNTINPVLMMDTLPNICSQFSRTCETLTRPPAILKSLVSNVARGLIRVQMTGVRPMASQMARTRLSMSPYGGRIMFGVTPSTSLMTCFDQPNSAMISSVERVVRGGWDQVWTAIWCPSMYSACNMAGSEITLDPTTKNVLFIFRD